MHRVAFPVGSSLLRVSLASLALVHGGCRDRPGPLAPPSAPAPDLAVAAVGAAPATQTYIVTLRADVPDVRGEAQRLAHTHGAVPRYTYERALRGFSVTLPEQAAAALARAPGVLAVRPAVPMRLADVQASPPWGLDRIDQPDLPLDRTYNYGGTGAGYTAYIFDTGIRTTHTDFGGRASTGWTVPDGLGAVDCHGHGTHVAGTVGSATYGVAKGVQLVAVRVFGTVSCDGSDADLLAGIDWLIANRKLPAVANMSLGFGEIVPEVDSAVSRLIDSGVAVVVAAGNSGVDACGQSPSNLPAAVTVAASDGADRRSVWFLSGASNYGACVDIFAPGSDVLSTSATGNTATEVMNGSSMAAPHVAGAIAYTQAPVASDAVARVLSGAVANRLSNIGAGSPNRLLNTNLTVDCGSTGCTPPPSDPRLDQVAIGGPYTGTEGAEVAVGIVGAADPTLTYEWDFGDMSAVAGPTATHVYVDSDVYVVKLTAKVTSDPTLFVTRTTTVTVANVPPTVSAGSDTTIIAGTSFYAKASFTDPSPNDAFWYYTVDFGDGGSPYSSLRTTQGAIGSLPHTYAAAGTYRLRVTVTDKDGDAGVDDAMVIVVPNTAPVASVNGPYTGKEGTAVAFSSAGTSDPDGQTFTYSWDFGDGTTSAAANPSKVYADDGTFTVTLTVKDRLGTAASAATTATIENVAPTASFSVPYSAYEGAQYTLSLYGNDAGSADRSTLEYAFDCGQGAGWSEWSTSAKSVTCPAVPDQDTLTLQGQVRDDEGAATSVAKQLIIRNVAPAPTLAATSATTIAPGTTVSFVGQFSDPGAADGPWSYTFAWGDGTASVSGTASAPDTPIAIDHQYLKPGTWYATLTVKDNDGASWSSTRISVSVSNTPPVAAANGPYVGNEGSAVAFSSAGSSDPEGQPLTYSWSFGDGTTSTSANPSKAYADNGSYTVTLTVKDPSGATATSSTTATIQNVAPTASFGAPSFVNEGAAYTISLTGTDAGSADRATLEYSLDCGQGGGWTPWSAGVKSTTCPALPDQSSLTAAGRVRDKEGGTTQYSRAVTIRNVAPVATLAAMSATSFAVGGTLDVQISIADAGVNDAPWAYTVYWGDGTSSTGTAATAGAPIQVSHTYAKTGTFSVSAMARDKDGTLGSSNRITVIVSP